MNKWKRYVSIVVGGILLLLLGLNSSFAALLPQENGQREIVKDEEIVHAITPRKIGIEIGHWPHEPGAVCPDGVTEAEINHDIGMRLAAILQTQGHTVDIFPAEDNGMYGYSADAFIAIHSDYCADGATGYKIARHADSVIPTVADDLVNTLYSEYGAQTNLPTHGGITDNMRYYYAFSRIDPQTPAAIIELGFISTDRPILIDEPGKAARGIANGLLDFLGLPQSIEYYLPYSPDVGGIRISRTGLLYEQDYANAGHPTTHGTCNTTSYCNGLNGEYHDYNDNNFTFTRGAIDFSLPEDAVILAAAGGTVEATGGSNCQVKIRHSDGTVAYYLHNSIIHVSPGLPVDQGDPIATVGSCGDSTGRHLHFSLWSGSQEIKVYFEDDDAQAHGGIVRPSRTGYVEYRYTADGSSGSNCQSLNTTFCDVPDDHPFYEAIETLYSAGMVNGCYEQDGNLYFCPDAPIIRQHAAYLNARWLYEYSSATYQNELPPPIGGLLHDISGESEATRVIEMLYRDGVVNGFSDGYFYPLQDITRTEFVYMTTRILLKHQPVGGSSCSFSDTTDAMILRACDLGIIGGYSDGTFRPDMAIDRGQAAVVICRAFLNCEPTMTNPELVTLRNNARIIAPAGQLCFTASGTANSASMPGLTVTSDGMLACYDFATDTYLPYEGGVGGEVEYRISPFDPDDVEICHLGGADTNNRIVSLAIEREGAILRAELEKCYGGSFGEGGEWCVLVNGQEEAELCDSYSDGGTTKEIVFDPAVLGLPAHNTYQARVYSNDTPNDPKYSGEVDAWSVPLPISQDYYYDASEDWQCLSNGIVEMKLDPWYSRRTLEVEVAKCDGSAFSENGYFYILLDGQRQWGPFAYESNETRLSVDLDVYGELGLSGSRTYQIELYSDDQPTDPKFSGTDNAWVIFEDLCYSLTVDSQPQIGGGVTVDPMPNCGTLYQAGTSVTLSANSAENYEFDHWSGDTSSMNNPVTLTMNENKSVTAHFILAQVCYSLTTNVNPVDSGYVDVLTPPNCPNDEFEAGTQVQLEAIPFAGYEFSNWSGDASGTSTLVTVSMGNDYVVTANFSLEATPTPTSTPTQTPSPTPTHTPTPTGTPMPGALMVMNPADQTVTLGSAFSVDITAEDVDDLGAFEFEVSFPAALMEVTQVDLGDFLGSTGRTVIPTSPEIDNVTGLVTYGAASIGSQSGPSGSGVLATIHFNSLLEGSSSIIFDEGQLADVSGVVIPVGLQNATVTIQACYWADLDCDGDVDIIDIQLVAGRWNTQVGDPDYDSAYDLDDDGDIDIIDVQMIASEWGWEADSERGATSQQKLANDSTLIFAPNPEDLELAVGEVVTLSLTVADAQNLAAFETVWGYDATLLEVEAVTISDFLASSGRQVFPLPANIDNENGEVAFGAASLGEADGVDGEGTLAHVRLRGIGTGNSGLDIRESQASEPDATPISVTEVDGSVTVTLPTGIQLQSVDVRGRGGRLVIGVVLFLVLVGVVSGEITGLWGRQM